MSLWRKINLSLLLLGLSLLLLGCEGSNAKPFEKKDRWLRYKAHHSLVPQTSNWQAPMLKHISYFGRYRHSDDPFHNYGGDPYGPIVAVWQIARYLGEEPVLKECGKKPKISSDLVWNTPEYKEATTFWKIEIENYYECHEKNTEIKEQATTYKHYYARSPNNYRVVAPKRVKTHASYEINASFGPKIKISPQGLRPEHLAIKEQLYYDDCRNLALANADKDCYRLPGKEQHFYYNIRSLLEQPSQSEKASSPYQDTPLIRDDPVKWEEIKGIEITPSQYAYLQKRCSKHVFDCHLDKDAPDLSPEQHAYIKATAWDLDNDFELRDALGEAANDYRVHP